MPINIPSSGGAGNLELIGTVSAPVANILQLTGFDLSNFSMIQAIISGLKSASTFIPQVQFTSGSAPIVTGYHFYSRTGADTSSTESQAGANVANIDLLDTTSTNWQVVSAAENSYSGVIQLSSPFDSFDKHFNFNGIGSIGNSGATLFTSGGGRIDNISVIDGIKVSGSAALTGGRLDLYGILKG